MTEDIGHYSIIRYTSDFARGEFKNLAVVVVHDSHGVGAIRAAPLSRIAGKDDQGVIDAVLRGLAHRINAGDLVSRSALESLAGVSAGVLSLTQPRPTQVTSTIKPTVDALYRALVGVKPRNRDPHRKGEILDQVIAKLRSSGAPVARQKYVGDFIFDAVVEEPAEPTALQVLSFAVGRSTVAGVEREAAHLVLGHEKAGIAAAAVVQAPVAVGSRDQWASFDRVKRWLDDAGVEAVQTNALDALAARFAGFEQLPLEA